MKLVVAALIVQNGKVLICQRTRHQTMPLKWEFPGGKVEPNEQPVDALRRELEEELGIRAQIGPQAAVIRHTYKDGTAVELTYDFLEADITLVKDIAQGKINLIAPEPRKRL